MNTYQKWMLTGLCTASFSLLAADQPAHSMNDPKKSQKDNSLAEITPPAGPKVDTGARFLLTADFIYWQVKEDNLGNEFNSSSNSFSGQTQTTLNNTLNLDFKYAPGFEVGAGVVFDHDNWDILANYTWLQQNHAKGHASGSNNQNDLRISSPIFGNPASTSVENDSARWTCHFNNIDLELGRQFFISKQLVLRPHVGLKGSWINQRYNTLSVITITNYGETGDPAVGNGKNRYHQDFWGIGLRAGLNTAWHFTRNWSIYGNIAASELACRFKNSTNNENTLTDVKAKVSQLNINHTNGSFHMIRPVLELALGIRYEMLFSEDRYQFFVEAGWEQQTWWNQNQISAGDLTLQGLDVKLGFAF